MVAPHAMKRVKPPQCKVKTFEAEIIWAMCQDGTALSKDFREKTGEALEWKKVMG